MNRIVHQTPEQRAAERAAASDIEFIAAGRCWLAGYRAGIEEDGYRAGAEGEQLDPVVMNPLEVAANLERRYPGGLAAAREQLITASLEAERR
ncbi:hypothetical protein [Nocardia carnea]|uniref:hypothetical protein n=1 Tax=Nocardia carnea TaxID=37328 RepID=UPI0024545851|nr:hypothetical protein [Nocardia carnea]